MVTGSSVGLLGSIINDSQYIAVVIQAYWIALFMKVANGVIVTWLEYGLLDAVKPDSGMSHQLWNHHW